MKKIDIMYRLVKQEDHTFQNEIFTHALAALLKESNNKEGLLSNGITYERNLIINLAYVAGKLSFNSDKNNDIISGDILKEVSFDINNDVEQEIIKCIRTLRPKSIKQEGNKCYTRISPDFVVHDNSEKSTDDNYLNYDQQLVVEAKTAKSLTQKRFDWDFFKLNLYVEKLKFKEAIYYICGSSKKTLENRMKEYNYFICNDLEKIIIIWQKDLSSSLEIYTIKKD